ncbi:phosphotransferase [Sulfurimonas sp.]
MGVTTLISLNELNKIFPEYGFVKLIPTSSGIIDTTYKAYTKDKGYILKKYEREIPARIERDIELLDELYSTGLNVPICLEQNGEWYLYKKLQGTHPSNVKSYHIQALARFLAKLHKQASKKSCDSNERVENEVTEALDYTKGNYFSYYKKFEFLKHFTHKNDALIHGDIFKDNTIFDGKKIGVIDFIDSACGTFAYDVGVALVGFDVRERHQYFINLFLKTYNQHAPKKLNKKTVLKKMKIAASFYALKRVYKYKNTFRARELLR